MSLYRALTIRLKFAAQLGIDTLLLLTWKVSPYRCRARVLIVRLDGIGDFVLWLDAARATVRFYKAQGMEVILVAHSLWAEWARELAIFDDVIALDRRRFDDDLSYRFRFGCRLRKLGCSIAVNPTYSREWLFGDSVIRVCGAGERIGFSGDLSNIALWQRRLSDRSYTRLISASPLPCMELVRNAEFVRGLGEVDYLARVADLRALSPLKLDEAFLAAHGGDQNYYVLFPGSGVSAKRWPLACFAELADQVYCLTGWSGVVCGGAEDVELARTLCKRSSAPLLNWAGRTNLAQLAAILSRGQVVVANDTSAIHIAAACGVQAVCILGGGHYGRFLPYQIEQADDRPLPRGIIHRMSCFGCYWRCIYGESSDGLPYPCVDRVTVAAVWRDIKDTLRLIVSSGKTTLY